MAQKRLVVLISGSGTNLQALLDRPDLGGDVCAVVADRAHAPGLERARAVGVDAVAIDLADYADRARWEADLARAVDAARPDLIVLAGFMRLLSADFVRRPTINVHPSLLPAFPGAHAVADALAYGVKVTGATVHFVDEQVDHGAIIAQEPVAVADDDTPATLHGRIQAVEHRLLPECVRLFCLSRLVLRGRQVKIVGLQAKQARSG